MINSANQRTRRTEADSSYWDYEYDSLGQVISGRKYWANGASVAGQQHEYVFDDIGNRKTAKMGGNQSGANLRTSTYGANLLNQHTNRTVPAAVDKAL
jgi:YD repeat-containing protein